MFDIQVNAWGINYSANTNNLFSQMDTTLLYNTYAVYGKLDIRIAKSPSSYYYINEGKTFSYRESSPGVRTEKFLDMLAWNLDAYTQGNLREKNEAKDLFVSTTTE